MDILRTVGRAIIRAFGWRIGWVIAGIVLLSLGFDARAHTCPSGESHQYQANDPFSDPDPVLPSCIAAITAAANAHVAAQPLFNPSVDSFACSPDEATGTYRFINDNQPAGTIVGRTIGHICTPAESCQLQPGDGRRTTLSGITEEPTVGSSYCVDNCNFVYEGTGPVIELPGGGSVALDVYVDEDPDCGGEITPTPEQTEVGECVTDSVGNQVCGFEPPSNCGQVNGEQICLGQAPDNSCASTPGGQVVCFGSNPPSSAIPDDGTGSPADPDAEVTESQDGGADGRDSVIVYNQNTVNNSTQYGDGGDPTAVGSCGAPGQPACKSQATCGGPGQPPCNVKIVGDDVGLAKEGTDGQDGGEGDGDCDPATETCAGTGTVTGPGGTTTGFGDATQGFIDGLGDTPLGQLADGLGSAMPDSGTCTTATFDALGDSFTFDSHCTVFDEYYSVFRAIFAFIWIMLGCFIVLRA